MTGKQNDKGAVGTVPYFVPHLLSSIHVGGDVGYRKEWGDVSTIRNTPSAIWEKQPDNESRLLPQGFRSIAFQISSRRESSRSTRQLVLAVAVIT